MRGVQSRGGSQVLGSGVGELIEDGEVGGADREVEDGVLDHAWWRTAPGASADHSPRTPPEGRTSSGQRVAASVVSADGPERYVGTTGTRWRVSPPRQPNHVAASRQVG